MDRPLCKRCGNPIPKKRLERAKRAGVETSFCSERCRVAAKQARYRDRKPKIRQDLLHLRNLVAHGIIAEKLRQEPALVQRALDTLQHWQQRQGRVPALMEWEVLLKAISNKLSSPDPQTRNTAYLQLLEVILDPSEEGMRLRSSSPFSDVLDPVERSAIFEKMR